MITDRLNLIEQGISCTLQGRTIYSTKRSVSYNDLKKKRLLRSDRSRGKFLSRHGSVSGSGSSAMRCFSTADKNCHPQTTQRVHTAQTKNKNEDSDRTTMIARTEKKKVMAQHCQDDHSQQQKLSLNDGDINHNYKCDTARTSSAMAPSSYLGYRNMNIITAQKSEEVFHRVKNQQEQQGRQLPGGYSQSRNQNLHSQLFYDRQRIARKESTSMFTQSVDIQQASLLIKNIISKKKNQNKLLKYADIRAEVKRSKSKSKSKSKSVQRAISKSMSKSKIKQNPKQVYFSAKKLVYEQSSQSSMKYWKYENPKEQSNHQQLGISEKKTVSATPEANPTITTASDNSNNCQPTFQKSKNTNNNKTTSVKYKKPQLVKHSTSRRKLRVNRFETVLEEDPCQGNPSNAPNQPSENRLHYRAPPEQYVSSRSLKIKEQEHKETYQFRRLAQETKRKEDNSEEKSHKKMQSDSQSKRRSSTGKWNKYQSLNHNRKLKKSNSHVILIKNNPVKARVGPVIKNKNAVKNKNDVRVPDDKTIRNDYNSSRSHKPQQIKSDRLTEQDIQSTEKAIRKIESLIFQTKSSTTIPTKKGIQGQAKQHKQRQPALVQNEKSQSKVPIEKNQRFDEAIHELSAIEISGINISGISLKQDNENYPLKSDSYLNIVEDLQNQQENHYTHSGKVYNPLKYQLPVKERWSKYDSENLYKPGQLLDILLLPSKQLKERVQSKNRGQRKKSDSERIHNKAFPKNFFQCC